MRPLFWHPKKSVRLIIGDQVGSATVLLVAISMVFLTATLTVLSAARVSLESQRLTHNTNQVALLAADVMNGFQQGDPCTKASEFAVGIDLEVTSCRIVNGVAEIQSRQKVLIWELRYLSRAG